MQNHINDFLMETHFINTLCKQKVKMNTIMPLNVKWVPRLRDIEAYSGIIEAYWSIFRHIQNFV